MFNVNIKIHIKNFLLFNNYRLTPSEIFKPYYGMMIGNYIHQLFTYLK